MNINTPYTPEGKSPNGDPVYVTKLSPDRTDRVLIGLMRFPCQVSHDVAFPSDLLESISKERRRVVGTLCVDTRTRQKRCRI